MLFTSAALPASALLLPQGAALFRGVASSLAVGSLRAGEVALVEYLVAGGAPICDFDVLEALALNSSSPPPPLPQPVDPLTTGDGQPAAADSVTVQLDDDFWASDDVNGAHAGLPEPLPPSAVPHSPATSDGDAINHDTLSLLSAVNDVSVGDLQDLEVVIVDDGSGEATRRQVQRRAASPAPVSTATAAVAAMARPPGAPGAHEDRACAVVWHEVEQLRSRVKGGARVGVMAEEEAGAAVLTGAVERDGGGEADTAAVLRVSAAGDTDGCARFGVCCDAAEHGATARDCVAALLQHTLALPVADLVRREVSPGRASAPMAVAAHVRVIIASLGFIASYAETLAVREPAPAATVATPTMLTPCGPRRRTSGASA